MKLSVQRQIRGKRVTVGVKAPKVADPRILKRYLAVRAERLWRGAVQAFLRELVSHIKIDTGMSYASVLPLASKVRLASELERDLTPRSPKRKGYGGVKYAGDGSYHPNQFRSRAHGKQLGKQAVASKRHLVSFGSDDDLKLKFRFEIAVYQYDYHEINSSWQSIEKAKVVFLKYWRTNLKKQIKSKDLLQWIAQGNIFDA